MDEHLNLIETEIYEKLKLKISDFNVEKEGKEYCASRFKLNKLNIISRDSKITPKKVGQFVTFWKRNDKGITQPFEETDNIDFYIINIRKENQIGQFVFPKSELIKRGIISTGKKEGKRGFRVYADWDKTESNQAQKTQKWQLKYFYQINDSKDLKYISRLYKNK